MVAGIACGVLCAACVLAYLTSVRGEADAARAEALARYGGEQVEVCVARRDVAAGEKVDAAAVETRLWVADLLPADAVRAAGDVVGRTAWRARCCRRDGSARHRPRSTCRQGSPR